jgi:solute carrier family 29 (equilibrative nucleoside transporter), member 1/2/3
VVHASRLWLWSLARLAFIPLFLLCNVEASVLPAPFHSDWWPTLFMLAFATSNGYISSIAMMVGPQQLGPHAAPALAEAAGITMVLLMTMGLSAGSALSFLVTAASKGRF